MSPDQKFYDFIAYVREYLKIPDEVNIECDWLDSDAPQNGMVIDQENSYLILIKPYRDDKDIMRTLAHELIHVKQYIFCDLALHLELMETYREQFSALYKIFMNDPIKYLWWEKEAYQDSVIIMELYFGLSNDERFLLDKIKD